MNLDNYGWNDFLDKEFEKYDLHGYRPARVISEHKHIYKLITQVGEVSAKVSGKFRYGAENKVDFPTVGDWVAASIREREQSATIHQTLPRRSYFSRKNDRGNSVEEEVVAANFDYAFIVTALNEDYNLRRIERYLTTAWESGGIPVVVLSKIDLCRDVFKKIEEVRVISPGVSIYPISSLTGEGIDKLYKYLKHGNTITLIGSSGVGKSTLINKLAGEKMMETNEVREYDSKGKHTTTHRQLLLLPTGGLIIDTPGMRELGLWDSSTGITSAFEDIEKLAQECKFRDCNHESEPGCAVKAAIEKGILDLKRFESYKKLKREQEYLKNKRKHSLRLKSKKFRK